VKPAAQTVMIRPGVTQTPGEQHQAIKLSGIVPVSTALEAPIKAVRSESVQGKGTKNVLKWGGIGLGLLLLFVVSRKPKHSRR